MEKEGLIVGKGILLGLGALLLGVSFVFGAIVTGIADGTTFFNFDENNNSAFFNITVNNTNYGQVSNITEVNITLPDTFTYITGTQNTTVAFGNFSFSNTSTVLRWQNTSGGSLLFLINGSVNRTSFWFNASASTPGNYTVIVRAANFSVYNETNITVRINDTVVPSLSVFISPGLTVTGNHSANSIPINISVTDAGIVELINITLYNSSSDLINNSILTNSSSGNKSFYFNFTALEQGTYYVNATVNDSFTNANNTATLTILLDNVNPNITFTCSPTVTNVGSAVTCSCTGTDEGGIDSTTFTNHPSVSAIGTFTTTCNVTDYAGNSVASSFDYTVNSAGAAPGTTNGGTTYTKTYVVSNEQFAEGYTKEVSKNEKMRFTISGKTHNVGVTSLTANSATISVFSTPQEATLQVGDTRKFDVDADDFYDISIKLESIESNKAKLTLTSIRETVTPETTAAEETAEEEAVTTRQADEGIITDTKERDLTTLWIIIGVIVVLVLVGIGYKVKKK